MMSTKRRERRHCSRNSIDSSLRSPMLDVSGLREDAGLLKHTKAEKKKKKNYDWTRPKLNVPCCQIQDPLLVLKLG